MTTENVKTADKKPEVYTDPTGKKRVRMVSVDREIIKKESKVNEISTSTLRRYVDKAGPKADAGDRKRQDGEARAAKKITKSPNVKVHSTEMFEDEEGYIGGKDEKGRDYHEEGKKSSAHNQKILRIIGSAQNMDQAIKMVMKSHNADEKKAKTLVHRAVKSAFYGESVEEGHTVEATIVASEATMSDKAGPGKGKDMKDMSKLDHDKFMKYGDSNPKGRADPAWNAERKRRYKNSQASMYRKMKKEEVENAIGGSSMLHKEGYIGAKGEKGRDYHNAGTFDKETAYSHAKKHNGVVHKDPSGKYLVKHGKGKHVGEGYRDPFKAAARSAKHKELSHEYEREKQLRRQKAQKSASQNKSFSNVRSRMEQQVDEISKGKLKKYVAKATSDAGKASGDMTKGDPDAALRLHKRISGVNTAQAKLDKMKKQKKEQKYVVKYTHATDSKSGRTSGLLSKKAADKKAAMGNKVDKVGGKYTVIPHVEKMDPKQKHKAQKSSSQNKSFSNVRSRMEQLDPFKEETATKSFKSLVSELTDKERAEIAASKARRLSKKAAVASKRQAEKDRPKRAKAGEDDHVIMQLRKAQDLGGNTEIRFHKGKSGKSNARDIDHVLKFHDTLKKPDDKRKLRIQLAKGGPAAVKKYADLYRKVTKTS